MLRNFFMLQNEPDGTGGAPSLVDPGVTTTTQPPKDESTPPASTPPAADPSIPEWLKGVDPELAKDKSLSSITDLNNLAKSYVNAQKMIGKPQIALPDEFATDEDWKQVYKKLGLPDKLEEYKAELAESPYLDEAFRKEFLKNAHEAGVLPKQAQKMYDFFHSQTDAAVKNSESQGTKYMEEQVTKLQGEWGNGFNKELKIAQIALQQFADEGMLKELKESGLDSNPTLIRLMNKIGKNLNEDTFSRQTVAHLGVSMDEAKSEVGKMMGDMAHPYWNGDHPNHKSAVDRMLKLQEIISSASSDA